MLFEEVLNLLALLKNDDLSYKDTTLSQCDDLISLAASLASFTDISDPWATEKSLCRAKSCLDPIVLKLQSSPKLLASTIGGLLHKRIKPSFLRYQNPNLTCQGRKAIDPLPSAFESMTDEREKKPWRYIDVSIATVFRWIVSQMDVSCILNVSSLLAHGRPGSPDRTALAFVDTHNTGDPG